MTAANPPTAARRGTSRRRSLELGALIVALLLPVVAIEASAQSAAKPATIGKPTSSAKPPAAGSAKRAPVKRKATLRPAPAEAAPVATPIDTARAAWTQARALADQDRNTEALAVIASGLAASPGNTDLLWLQAGVTGNAGRNREAVALYEALMLAHPELARDLRSDLATQRLWAGDAAGAVRDFDLRIEEDPSDREARRMRALALSHADRLPESLAAYDALIAQSPDDVDPRLDRARVLAWMGRNREAADAYREILTTHPDERRAQFGLAQNENWSGHHRRAADLFEQMRETGAKDPEITKGLAYAYYWDGQADQSRQALDDLLTARPDDREGLELARMLQREGSPSFTGGFERSDDSDALRVRTTVFEYRLPLRGHTTLVARWRRDNVKDNAGNRDPYQAGGGIETRWSTEWSTQLYAYALKPDRDEDLDMTGEFDLTHRPTERVRIDLGVAKEPILTRISLENHIVLRSLTAGFDWRFTEQATLSASERVRRYSDGNHANLSSASVQAWVITGPRGRLATTFGFEQLRTRDDLDHGYYDPEQYTEFGPGAVLELYLRPRWTLNFNGKLGRQREKGAEAEPFNNFTAGLEFPLGTMFGVNVLGGRGNSNLSSASGFKQNRWAAYLTTRF